MHHIAAPVCIELVELAVDQLVDYVELFGSLVVDMVIAGDFNRHDQLWGGEDVSLERQGEADQIIGLMSEYALSSLLQRGTKTWQGEEHEEPAPWVKDTMGARVSVMFHKYGII
ncbi:hypothetical protein FOPG_17453 [Fusarium oxysporum f. sp. conglutinans race 2 54008]|uniref:Endonuclease/exonuclease/phosphatase domain-containing protein n=1 Tax=Fusarium oxysporum f. sp. conglutinans race 2 54008 TaxID=1089457 RepID=X0H2W1_FUSOX|nr:hypothetical protein FOPG_17453 [Fusarium oxysporum f. sp. conglutinans race 2 54008]